MLVNNHPQVTRENGGRNATTQGRTLLITNWRLDGMEFPLLRNRFEDCAVWGLRTPWNPRSILFKLLRHWPGLFISALRGYGKSRDYDVIITWHPTVGLFMGMLFRIFRRSRARRTPRSRLLVLNMIDVERRGITGYLRRGFLRFCLGGVDRVTSYTHAEAERLAQRYHLPPHQSICVRQGLQKRFLPDAPVPLEETESYIFASGRSLRDYKTLFAAVRGTPFPVKVVCQDHNVAGLDVPSNVEMHLNVYGEKVQRLRRSSRLVVIPLEREDVSAGQYDILLSMGEGKPLIVTKTVSSALHVTDGKDALFVNCRDSAMLRRTIEALWGDNDRLRELGRNAFETVRHRFCFDTYERAVIELVEGLLDERS